MDECDRGLMETENYLAAAIACCRVETPGAENGCCRVCGERIPERRLALGCGTCILCQEELEAAGGMKRA